MDTNELNRRSPLRVLDQCIHGGLGAGNIGVIVARHGVGKSAFLVGVALDHLLRGHKLLHVSLQHDVEKVRTYYDDIFADLAHERDLQDVWQVRLNLERNRRIHSFLNGSFSVDRLRDTLEFMRTHTAFEPKIILIDGYDLSGVDRTEMGRFKKVACSLEAQIWMAAVTTRDAMVDARGIPEPVAHLGDSIDVVLSMAHNGVGVRISLLKDHDNPDISPLSLVLDPTTMLVVRDDPQE